MANEQAGQVHGMTAAHCSRNYGGNKYQQKSLGLRVAGA
jgi:hypothetical protein